MNKGLEAYYHLSQSLACCNCQYWKGKKCTNYKGTCIWLDIETELKRAEEKEHNCEVYLKQMNGLVSKLANNEKKLKALEIIVNKVVDIQWLMKCENASTYNRGVGSMQRLKRTEFKLLKEVVK